MSDHPEKEKKSWMYRFRATKRRWKQGFLQAVGASESTADESFPQSEGRLERVETAVTQIRDATERYLHHLIGSAEAGREMASTLALYSHPTEVALPRLAEERGSFANTGAGESSPGSDVDVEAGSPLPSSNAAHEAEQDAEHDRRARELEATRSSLSRVYRAMSALRASVMTAIQTLLRDAVLRPCEQVLEGVQEGHRLYEKRKRYQTDVDSYLRRYEHARKKARESTGHQDDVDRLDRKLQRAQSVLQEYTDRLEDLLGFLEMQREDLIRQAGVATLAVQVHWFQHGAEALPTRTPYLPECSSALVHLSHLTRSAASGEARRRGITATQARKVRARSGVSTDRARSSSAQEEENRSEEDNDDETNADVPAWLRRDPYSPEARRQGGVGKEGDGEICWSQDAPRSAPLQVRRGTMIGRRHFPSYPTLLQAMHAAVGKDLPTEGRVYAGRVGGGDASRSERGRRLSAEQCRAWSEVHATVDPQTRPETERTQEREREAIDSSSPRSQSPGN